MPRIARIVLCGFIGTIVCAGLSFLSFVLLAVFDNQKLGEAFGYGLVVGMVGAFIGAFIGLAIGIGDLGVIGGGVAGLSATLIVVAIYVYSTADSPAKYGYFLGESRIIFVVLSAPTILTGIVTALLKNLVSKLRGRTLSPRQN